MNEISIRTRLSLTQISLKSPPQKKAIRLVIDEFRTADLSRWNENVNFTWKKTEKNALINTNCFGWLFNFHKRRKIRFEIGYILLLVRFGPGRIRGHNILISGFIVFSSKSL